MIDAVQMVQPETIARQDSNKLRVEDRAAHDWYRFVLSFPPHLVRHYLQRFGADAGTLVLDPFCGTGTTLVECKKHGVPSIGIEANPMACFASQTKVDWAVDPDSLLNHAHDVGKRALTTLLADGIEDAGVALRGASPKAAISLRTLPPDASGLLLKGSISALPLHKTLVLLDTIREQADQRLVGHECLALARALVGEIGNLHFGPEVGVGPPKEDVPVVEAWLTAARRMADDLRTLEGQAAAESAAHKGDARDLPDLIAPESVDVVITSPPYPNEKDYTRTTRLESVILGFIRSKHDLRALKQTLVRSNTRGVFKADDDDLLVAQHGEIQSIANQIEARRRELGKTSGFERLYARVTKLYFGGIVRHLSDLRTVLRPGAQLAYVVGDQASYLRVMIRTGQLLAGIAQSLGYEVVAVELFRTRLATATKEQLREEVVVLRWPGGVRVYPPDVTDCGGAGVSPARPMLTYPQPRRLRHYGMLHTRPDASPLLAVTPDPWSPAATRVHRRYT